MTRNNYYPLCTDFTNDHQLDSLFHLGFSFFKYFQFVSYLLLDEMNPLVLLCCQVERSCASSFDRKTFWSMKTKFKWHFFQHYLINTLSKEVSFGLVNYIFSCCCKFYLAIKQNYQWFCSLYFSYMNSFSHCYRVTMLINDVIVTLTTQWLVRWSRSLMMRQHAYCFWQNVFLISLPLLWCHQLV